MPGIRFHFASSGALFAANSTKKDISKVLAEVDAVDTSFALTTTTGEVLEPVKDSSVRLITSIQMRSPQALKSFFDALTHLKTDPTAIRVLHYGDSQIEGDRITDYLRLKLQGQFGGRGPGLMSLTPISPSVINRLAGSAGWDRYGIFTAKDKRVSHLNYGILAGFSRFAEYKKPGDSVGLITASLVVTTTKLGGTNAMAYNEIKLFYGGSKAKTWAEFYEGPALISADSLEAGASFRVKEYPVMQGSNTHTFKFSGKDSPDFYALSLESSDGVMVDNIALRGSSGTFFHQINPTQLKQFHDYLNTKLIILQFGGNALPAIKDATMAINYANYLRGQIIVLKKAVPGASILFIGPSDMSIKEGTDYVTYPYLEDVRDAIKKVALESDCAFFDMYDCMGGKNSMPGWVDQKLAASDYIHFSPQGARKIATLFYSALIREYNNYLKSIH